MAAPTTPAEPEVIKKGKKEEDEEEDIDPGKPRLKAIVGLGNPGVEVPGDAAQRRLRRWSTRWRGAGRLELEIVERRGGRRGRDGSTRRCWRSRKTFMNLSGEAVQRIAAFHKIEPSDVLVVIDEVQLPLGRLRRRDRGSAGGHNGLKSVIEHLGRGVSAAPDRRRTRRPTAGPGRSRAVAVRAATKRRASSGCRCRGRRCRRDVRRRRHRAGNEQIQRAETDDNRQALKTRRLAIDSLARNLARPCHRW